MRATTGSPGAPAAPREPGADPLLLIMGLGGAAEQASARAILDQLARATSARAAAA